MKQLTINPKEEGSTIKFGKLPIFTRSLTHWLDMDNVVQLKVEGRHYAIELRKSGLEKALDEMREQMGTYTTNYTIAKTETETPVEVKEEQQPVVEENFTPFKTHYQVGRDRFRQLKELEKSGALAECKNRLDICEKLGFEPQIRGTGYNWLSNQVKKGFLEERLVRYNKQNSGEYEYRLTGVEPNYTGNKHIQDRAELKSVSYPQKKLSNGLEELGFTNLSSKPASKPQPRKEGYDYAGKAIEQGDLSLFEWLKCQDYLIYKLFIYGNGQPAMDKVVDYEDIVLTFIDAGMPDSKIGKTKGKSARRTANMAVGQLLRAGIFTKEEPTDKGIARYSLSVQKGGVYARGVYRTVSAHAYEWDSRKGRVHHA